MPDQAKPFTYTPLGPWSDDAGEWCCGLHCNNGGPCPYTGQDGRRLRPKPEPARDGSDA